jgi:glutamyl-tRNA synthetase
MRGRFAPSPTGQLHLGNLRTALVAWLAARTAGGGFLVRMEDLDPVTASHEHAARQLADLEALGIDHDGEVVFQSERFEWYRAAIVRLASDGFVYRCYCTRREIRDAASAPHGEPLADGAYPGTCRELSSARQAQLEREGRRSALRLRTHGERYLVDDRIAGAYEGVVDDVVLERNDGVPAYNLAVVVDDHLQAVTQVVRGDDLLSSTPRQMHLQRLLGYQHPEYAHVPLVLGPDGSRLAKRHGAVTLADLAARGIGPAAVLAHLAVSLGLDAAEGSTPPSAAADLLEGFSFDRIERSTWQPHLG